MTARETLQALIEGKRAHFDPDKHPRDRHGRFAHIGEAVSLDGGGHGKITDIAADGKLTVRKEDGSTVHVASKKVTKMSGGRAIPARVESVQVTQLQPGDRIQHRKGTNYWSWRNKPKGTPDHERPIEGTVAKIEDVGARGASGLSSAYGNVEVTLADGKVIRWNKVARVDRVTEDHGLTLLPKQGRKEGTGTIDDPIAVGDDLARAAQLLADGKHVRLDQPEQVATLLDKLREIADDARSKGEKAPKYDLCRVSVPGTNLFCKQSKGIPRAKMPQFKGEIVPGSPAEAFRTPKGNGDISEPFRNALAAMGLPIEAKTVPASHLRASQNELDGAKIAEMMSAMEKGLIKDAPIFVTRDGYVIDGHHRWAAKIAIDTRDGKVGDVMMPVEIVDLDIGAAIDYANAFAKTMGIAPKSVHQGKVISLTVPSVERSRPSLAVKDIAPSGALLDGEGPGEEVPAQAMVAASPVLPRRSRIADHLDAVYAQTPRHHVVRAIDAAYARAGDPPVEDAKEA